MNFTQKKKLTKWSTHWEIVEDATQVPFGWNIFHICKRK